MAGKHQRVVGILGGMGPEATLWLMQRILALTPAQDDSEHVPLLVDNNTQVPSRIKAIIEGTGEDPCPVLRGMAQRLQACGAEALAMPCNTAHFYAPAIAQSVDIPLLNMLDLTAAQAITLSRSSDAQPVRRAGLLASPAVRMTGVFDQAFAKTAIETQYPRDDQPVLDCIKAIKAGLNDSQTLAKLNGVIAELGETGSDLIVVACSELSILKEEFTDALPKIDSIDVLARAVIDFSNNPVSYQ